MKSSGIDEKTLDKHIINLRLGLEGESSLNDIDNLILRISEGMNKPKDYVENLILSGLSSISRKDFFSKVAKPWNDYCKKRFNELKREHHNKKNILVNVGMGHLPAFL